MVLVDAVWDDEAPWGVVRVPPEIDSPRGPIIPHPWIVLMMSNWLTMVDWDMDLEHLIRINIHNTTNALVHVLDDAAP